MFNIINQFNIPISLSGGEPGLVHPEIFQFFFDNIKTSSIIITTNGTLFNIFAPNKIKSNIKINYHIVHLDNFNPINHLDIIYSIVITANNIHFLEHFLQQHKSLFFYLRFNRINLKEHSHNKLNNEHFNFIKELHKKYKNF